MRNESNSSNGVDVVENEGQGCPARQYFASIV